MCRRVSAVFLALLFTVLFCGYSEASVEGSWTADVVVKVKVSAKKLGSESFSDHITDSLAFNADGSFYSDYLELGGGWSQNGAKYTINFDADEVVSAFKDLLWTEYGLEADMTVAKNSFNGKESKAGDKITGNGSIILEGIVYADCGDVPGKIKMTIKIKGVR